MWREREAVHVTTSQGTLDQTSPDELPIEHEDTQFRDIERPWDPESIRVSTNSFSLRNMIDLIADGSLDLAPDFQRLQVWNRVQKAQLIESVLLQIPLPAFYFAEDADGMLQVVDGVQRLSTINDFVTGGANGKGGFALNGLEYLADVKGKRFDALPTVWKRRIHNTQIVAHVIAPTTPSDVMYDIFRRINTGGTPLTGQEIRHCVSKKRSRTFLKRLVGLPEFSRATPPTLLGHKRMVDHEVALRFTAFWHLTPEQYSVDKTLDSFLLQAIRDIDDPTLLDDQALDDISVAFARGLDLAHKVFGAHAFRKWPTGNERLNPLNRALFEAWTVELAKADPSAVTKSKSHIRRSARNAMAADDSYIASISSATGGTDAVQTRFDATRAIIVDAINR